MGLIETLRKIVDGPGNCEAFVFGCKSEGWVNRIGYASEMSGCNYTILQDPENKEYSMFVTGTLAQLRECVSFLESFRRDRS